MGIMDKLMFWKHKDPDFSSMDLGANPSLGEAGGLRENSFGKEDDLGLGFEDSGIGTRQQQNYGNMNQSREPMPSIMPQNRPMMQPQISSSNMMLNKDIELISAKLDALKATLDSVNQRLANLERIAREGI